MEKNVRKKIRVVLTGGGTGGHTFPLLDVAKELEHRLGESVEILYFGTSGHMEERTKKAMAEQGILTKHIVSGKMRRYFSFLNFIDVFKIPFGVVQALWHLLFFMPDVVFTKGGYGSVPTSIAAWLYRIPIFTHDSDSVPGLANRIIGKLAKRVGVAYPSALAYFKKGKAIVTGIPVDADIANGTTQTIFEKYHLTESKPVLFVTGGSQGSRLINESLIKIVPKLLHFMQVIHQTGRDQYEDVLRDAADYGLKNGRRGYHAVPFVEHHLMKDMFATADVVISRSGATAIAELAAAKKAVIYIPLSTAANNEQRLNAYEVAKIGGALVLEEGNLGPSILYGKIEKLLNDGKLRQEMGESAHAFYRPDASEKIVDGLLELIS